MVDFLTMTIPQITNADLTTGIVDGAGIFDKIMTSLGAHLTGQYEKNRITGADYTKAYIELTAAALSSAVTFLLQRDEAYWKAILAQQQAKNATIQEALIKEQIEVQRAQTMETRTDGTTPVEGAIGKQKALYTQQITSYQRDAEVKATKLFVDAWITMKTLDEGLLPPTNFANASLDAILTSVKTNNDIG